MSDEAAAAEAKPDLVRERFLENADACLNFVRKVKWGVGRTSYVITDRGFELNITIEVMCGKRAEEGKKP